LAGLLDFPLGVQFEPFRCDVGEDAALDVGIGDLLSGRLVVVDGLPYQMQARGAFESKADSPPRRTGRFALRT
jgi:hypothetical protein